MNCIELHTFSDVNDMKVMLQTYKSELLRTMPWFMDPFFVGRRTDTVLDQNETAQKKKLLSFIVGEIL